VLTTDRHWPYFELHEFSPPHPRRNVFAIYFNVILPSLAWFRKWFLLFSIFCLSAMRAEKEINK
jgi:hypothetical protein